MRCVGLHHVVCEPDRPGQRGLKAACVWSVDHQQSSDIKMRFSLDLLSENVDIWMLEKETAKRFGRRISKIEILETP